MPVVRLRGCLNLLLKNIKLSVHICEIDFLLGSGSTHIAGDIEIKVVLLLDLIKAEHPRIAILFLPVLVGIDDFVYVLGKERVLSLARLIMLCRVDEQNVVGPLAFLQHENADWYACRIEQLGWQADHRIYVTIFQKLGTYLLLSPAAEQDTMRQDNRHGAVLSKEVEPMQ